MMRYVWAKSSRGDVVESAEMGRRVGGVMGIDSSIGILK